MAYRAGGRAGTKAQKTRSEVHGTTRKSKRQKGGGARHGALTAPIFVGGGRTFAAKPRSFEQKVNRKMYRGALRSSLSELVRQDRLQVVDSLTVAEAKTALLVGQLKELGMERGLIVTESDDLNLYLAARNLPHVYVTDAGALDPVTLIHADRVLMTRDSVGKIEEWLA